MEELRKVKSLTNLYSSMGWKEQHTQFILGDTLIKHDDTGEVIEERSTLASNTSRSGMDMYSTAGTKETWAAATKILQQASMPWHMFAVGTGFAAPLFEFTGLKGMTVSLYGPTGGGKTLAQYWIQSIYGDPDKLHFAAKFTQNSLFSRLGIYNNLPMTIDEATMIQDKDIGDFLYWVSQGRDKARLNRSSEERDARTWATPVIVSTNISLQSKLIASGVDTDAQMARLLEINVPTHKLFASNSEAGQKIYKHLMSNFGCVGREYIKELVRLGPDNIRKLIEETRITFKNKYQTNFSGQERYWEQAVLLQELGSKIAARLGLITYDYTLGTKWILEQLGAIRQSASENKEDAFDILAEYLNDSADAAVTVMHTGTMRPQVDMTRMPRDDIRVRFDIMRPTSGSRFTHGVLLIHRTHFRKWLATSGRDYKTFVGDMTTQGVIASPKSNKAYLGKDTSAKLGQVTVIGFNLTHPRLEGILNDADQAVEDQAIRKLKLV